MKNWVIKKVYYTQFSVWYDRLKTNRLRNEVSSKGLNSSIEFDLKKNKKSDTLFVLGSALSIMDLTPSNWAEIKRHDSFGFNAWLFHDFVPTYYGIEPMANNELFDSYIQALSERKKEYEKTPIFVQYQHLKMRNKSFKHSTINQKNIWYNVPFMPNTTNERVLKKMINKWASIDHKDFSEVIHYAGSLSYVITMGYIMGYKKIVLLGVDLNSSEYYFSHKKVSKLAKAYYKVHLAREMRMQRNVKSMHRTLLKSVTVAYGCLPISTFVEYLRDAIKPNGVQLLIGSEGSALHPLLDLFKFQDKSI